MTNPPLGHDDDGTAAAVDPADDPDARVHIHDPAPLRQHADAFAARLDVATLAAAGIPAKVIEPRGPASGSAMATGRGPERMAIVMVPADQLEEAREELALARDTGWRADDAADVDSTATDGRPGAGGPFRPRGMPIPARIGLVVAVLMLLLGVAGAIAMLFIGP